jgi:arginyl-tRNA synthetase
MKFVSSSQIMQIAIANIINSGFEISLVPSEVLIDVCYPKYNAHYTTAIALAISHRLGIESVQIAEAIAQACSQNPEISAQWQTKAFGKGWLNIVLSQKFIFEHLFALEIWLPDTSDIAINSASKSPEPMVQYAYARCCALIRMAQSHPEIIESTSIISGEMEPVEISLLMQQLEIASCIENLLIIDRYKLSRSLAETFLRLYDCCRIFGVAHEVADRRLLLIKITRKLLLAIAPPEINYATYL